MNSIMWHVSPNAIMALKDFEYPAAIKGKCLFWRYARQQLSKTTPIGSVSKVIISAIAHGPLRFHVDQHQKTCKYSKPSTNSGNIIIGSPPKSTRVQKNPPGSTRIHQGVDATWVPAFAPTFFYICFYNHKHGSWCPMHRNEFREKSLCVQGIPRLCLQPLTFLTK